MPTWDVNFDTRIGVTEPDVLADVARIEALAAVIRNIPIPPGVQGVIDALNIMRAVRGTTGIEGSELSEEEVSEIISSPPTERVLPPSREREEKEVRNAERVMRFVAELVSHDAAIPLTEELIRQIHEQTTRGIDYPNNVPGHYREGSVRAGTYVPPQTGDEIRRLMREFIRWFNEGPPRSWPAAIQAIVAHFFVVSIHPFGDGNGRTARGVESFLLYRGGINARGFYSLANFYYRQRQEYEIMLDHVRFETEGNLTPFLRFALRGLRTELETVHEDVLQEVEIFAFRDYAREVLLHDVAVGSKTRERMYRFILGLPREPISISALKKGGHPLSRIYRGVTAKTVTRDLNFLRSRDLIAVDRDQVRANLDVMKQFMG